MEQADESEQFDPVYLHSIREAKFILVTFFLFATYTILASWLLGYRTETELPTTGESFVPLIWGIPRWVVLGVAAPWLLANLITWWFCFRWMHDDCLASAEKAAGSDVSDPVRKESGDDV